MDRDHRERETARRQRRPRARRTRRRTHSSGQRPVSSARTRRDLSVHVSARTLSAEAWRQRRRQGNATLKKHRHDGGQSRLGDATELVSVRADKPAAPPRCDKPNGLSERHADAPRRHVAGTLSAEASAQPWPLPRGGPLAAAPSQPRAGWRGGVLAHTQRLARPQPPARQDLLGAPKITEAAAPGPAERTCLGRGLCVEQG